MQVLFDHVGYEPAARKLFLIEAPGDTDWRAVEVVRLPAGESWLACEPVFAGAVAGWSRGPWWSLDVSDVREPGDYVVAWRTATASGQSEPFRVGEDVHGDQLVSDLVHYIKGQRCSGIWDRADHAAARVGDGVRRDVHGGWYDASGDYSKYLSHLSYANYMNPQQTPLVVWVLARVWHLLADDDEAQPLLLERIRDEALHGADFLMRMQDPEGFWYVTVFDVWSKDPAQRELCSYRTQLGIKGDDYQAGWRQGGGMAAAALALASTLGDGLDHTAAEYRQAALRGFRHLRQHGLDYLDDGRENIIDDTCALLAAVELASVIEDATDDLLAELERRAARLLDRRRETGGHVWLTADGRARSWFHASDEGLPGLTLLRLAQERPEFTDRAIELVHELAMARLRLDDSRVNPFGYPLHWIGLEGSPPRSQWFFPHDNESGYWWQGENSRVASLAAFMSAAARTAPDAAWASPARDRSGDCVGWILGRNPFDVCMVQGHGRNNPPYHPGFHNAPGGVCNGVTSGFDDEADIAFRPMPMAVDRLHSWRWSEQWMPHAAWLLYALVTARG